MAKPLNLAELGIPGSRNVAQVQETMGAIVPFTQGNADLEIDREGSVAPVDKPIRSETGSSNDVADKHFRSRIGRRFRSF